MLQVNFLRDNKELVVEGLKKRNFKNFNLVDEVLLLDENRKATQLNLDNLLSQLNTISRQIGEKVKAGKKDEIALLKKQTTTLKDKVNILKDALNVLEEKQNEFLLQIPNVPNKLVPAGKIEEDNEIIFQVKSLPSLFTGKLPHWDLAKKHNLIDFEMGSKVTGAGFPFYMGKGARLQRGLINYFLDYNQKAGYEECQPPLLVNERSALATGQLPDKEGQMYHATVDNLYLIPTAEVPVTNIFRDIVLNEKDLPKKITAYTPCFRREAGSYGAHVRGLNRLHQFDKVEIVQVHKPEDSYRALDEMVKHVENLIKQLNLPYRILRLCGGDLGFTSAITYDFEVFSAAQEKWLEVSSISNFETFQANRLKLRYRPKGEKKTTLCHTLNGSSLALPRILATLLENNQTPEGEINIPAVLKPYLGFDKIG